MKFVLVITLLTLLVWGKTLNQIFIEEGYYYFDPGQRFFTSSGITNIKGYDNGAKLIFQNLFFFFRENIFYYQLFQLIVYIILYSSLYFILVKISNSKVAALIAVIFFLSNYFGSYQMIASGNYQRFVQRIPNLIPVIFAFYFLFRYYQNQVLKYLLFSFLLYFLSVFMGHYSALLLPLFITYPLINSMRTKDNLGYFIRGIIISLVFILISFLITMRSDQNPNKSFLNFIKSENNLQEKILFPITLITIPQDLIEIFSGFIEHKALRPYIKTTRILTIPVIIFYIFGGFLIYKRKNNYFRLYLSILIALPLHTLIYQFIDGDKFNIYRDFGQERHFFISSIFTSTLLALIIRALFKKNSILNFSIIIIILISYVSYHSFLIWNNIDKTQYKYDAMKNFVGFLKLESVKFKNDSIVVIPNTYMGPASLIYTISNKPGIDFRLPLENWQIGIPKSKKENTFVYDYKYSDNRLYERRYGKPINWTENFRKGEKIKFYAQ